MRRQTSWTHWSTLYNLDDLTVRIATLGNYDEIVPFRLDAETNGWWVGEAKSARPQVLTNQQAYNPDAISDTVYGLEVNALGDSADGTPTSWEMVGVSSVNRMGCAYSSVEHPIDVVIRANCAGEKCKAAFYADMLFEPEDVAHWSDYVLAGVNEKGLAGRVTRLTYTGATGSLKPCRALALALLKCERIEEIANVLAAGPALVDVGLIFTDAMGNVAVCPEGAVLPTDDASALAANSLDLRKGIYETDGSGRGEFDELPGLMCLAADDKMRVVISMGYGHLDVATVDDIYVGKIYRTEVGGAGVPAYGVVAEPPPVAHTTATLVHTNGDDLVRNNQGRFVAATNVALKVTYRVTEPQYGFEHGAVEWPREFTVGPTATTPPAPGIPSIYLPGCEDRPWSIGATDGDSVVAWTNGMGTLTIGGEGRMRGFSADGSDLPWPTTEVGAVQIDGTVSAVGTNAWYGLADSVTYNGLGSGAARTLADGFGGVLGYVRTPFKTICPDGSVVMLSVALETTPSLTNEWTEVKLSAGSARVDDDGRILIRHQIDDRDQGFYVLQPMK